MKAETNLPELAFTAPMDQLPPGEQMAYVEEGEALGYSACWLVEGATFDSFSFSGAILGRTGLSVATAIVPIYNRTPMVLAMSAATLSNLGPGRFSLGLGSSSEQIIEGWNGAPLSRPLKRMGETIKVVRALLDGETVTVEGETLSLTGARLKAPPAGRVPIYVGALNERMLRLSGELADGVVINFLLPDQVPTLLAPLWEGAAQAGRQPEEIDVVLRLPIVPGTDAEAARARARAHFGPTVAAGGYNKFFRASGFQAEAEAVQAAYARRDRAAVAEAISDRLADALVAGGTVEECRARIAAYGAAGISRVILFPLDENPSECWKVLRDFAPGSGA